LLFARLPAAVATAKFTRRVKDFDAIASAMADRKTKTLSWPWWARWALLAVAATSALTVAATLYDIL
jgi:hypothetical protein